MNFFVGTCILVPLLIALAIHHRIIIVNNWALRRYKWPIIMWLTGTIISALISSLLS
jgi:hypothetical protein